MKTLAMAAASLLFTAYAQQSAWTDAEKPILDRLRTLRAVPDDKRGAVTRQLAADIRRLVSPSQLRLATNLAGLATEGDFGKSTLQEVAATLAAALERTPPAPDKPGQPAMPYMYLAQLVRYEHVQVALDNPQLKADSASLKTMIREGRRPTLR